MLNTTRAINHFLHLGYKDYIENIVDVVEHFFENYLKNPSDFHEDYFDKSYLENTSDYHEYMFFDDIKENEKFLYYNFLINVVRKEYDEDISVNLLKQIILKNPHYLDKDDTKVLLFASSLNKIGIPYRFSYAVSIALRYIPTIQEDFITISKAQQAKGIDVSKKIGFLKRIKNVSSMLLPLIFSSIEKIDIISNAMLLRGFGKKDKRTWYYARKIENKDYIAILITAVFIVISIVLIKINNGRYFNPFIKK